MRTCVHLSWRIYLACPVIDSAIPVTYIHHAMNISRDCPAITCSGLGMEPEGILWWPVDPQNPGNG